MAVLDYKPIHGKKELEGLVLGHYSDSWTFYREYIQNACDSIVEATKRGILPSIDNGHVAVTFSSHTKNIEIRDNGTGISKDRIKPILMDIYHSDKDGIDTAGRFGIGRLSGGGFCRELVFRTSYFGEEIETIFTLDVDLLRKLLQDDTYQTTEEVMQVICSVDYHPVSKEEHYMSVCLNQVIQAADEILDEESVINFIQDIAPIDYSTPFKQLVKVCVGEYKDKFDALRYIHVSVNAHTDIKKRYGLTIEGTKDEIDKLRFFTLADAQYGELAWGWYAVTPFSIQIPVTDRNAGIRLRCHNISLEQNILNQYFKQDRGNLYFYGEIFITHSNITPNTGRQGLSPTNEGERLKELFRQYAQKTLYEVYNKANKIKVQQNKVIDWLNRYLREESTLNEEGKKALLEALKNEENKYLTLVQKKWIDEIQDVVNIYQTKYNDQYKSQIDKLLGRIHSNPSIKPNVPPITPITQPTPHVTPPVTPPVMTSVTPPKTQPTPPISHPIYPSTPPAKPIKVDIFQRLANGGFDEKEVNLIRRVLGMMTVICPPQNKNLLEQLKDKTVDLLIANQSK